MTAAELARALVVEAELGGATSWRQVLEAAFPAVRCHVAGTTAQARLMFISARPQVVVVGAELAEPDLIAQMGLRAPGTWILVGASHIRDERLFPALVAGACGYLLRHEAAESLASEARAIVDGWRPLSPGLARQFLTHLTASPAVTLDDDESRILESIAAGATAQALTTRLGAAVATKRRRLYEKLWASVRRPVPDWNESAPPEGRIH